MSVMGCVSSITLYKFGVLCSIFKVFAILTNIKFCIIDYTGLCVGIFLSMFVCFTFVFIPNALKHGGCIYRLYISVFTY